MSWAKVKTAARWGLSIINLGASIYFLRFVAKYLTPYFAAEKTLGKETRRIRLCEASLVLSIGYSLLVNLRAFVKRCRSQDRNRDLERRSADVGRRNGGVSCVVQCFQSLYGLALLAITISTAVFAWRWWHALADLGKASLANQCRGLTIYSMALAALGCSVPPILFILVYTGRRVPEFG